MHIGGLPDRTDEGWVGGWGATKKISEFCFRPALPGKMNGDRYWVFYTAFDKPPNINLNNNGDWSFFITIYNSSKNNFQ